ncbi:hypothetical protein TWF788_010765 [Orbilia oligospora]|uniref:Uncharacterized protein n=1 Tax=Orbilia oligospora TaxID=2813651 RepID=A0A7C8KA37_ORBOL|nr:hypothetical protein TWF788_010765 [Orbilia oligospora]
MGSICEISWRLMAGVFGCALCSKRRTAYSIHFDPLMLLRNGPCRHCWVMPIMQDENDTGTQRSSWER